MSTKLQIMIAELAMSQVEFVASLNRVMNSSELFLAMSDGKRFIKNVLKMSGPTMQWETLKMMAKLGPKKAIEVYMGVAMDATTTALTQQAEELH